MPLYAVPSEQLQPESAAAGLKDFLLHACCLTVVIQALKIAEQSGIDFKSFASPHSVEYLHRFIDLQNVVWSDRVHFGGDPDFNDVPLGAFFVV